MYDTNGKKTLAPIRIASRAASAVFGERRKQPADNPQASEAALKPKEEATGPDYCRRPSFDRPARSAADFFTIFAAYERDKREDGEQAADISDQRRRSEREGLSLIHI